MSNYNGRQNGGRNYQSYGNSQYNQGYPQNYNGGGYNPQYQKPVKHSGCKKKKGWTSQKTGEQVSDLLLFGWNYSRSRGFMKFVASPKKENKETGKGRKTKNPNWENWTAKVSFKDGRKPEFHNCFYDLENGRLFFPDLEMVANPSKDYWGTYIRRR